MSTVILEDWVPGTRNYRIRATIMSVFAGIYTLFVLVTLIWFIIKARDKRSGLDKRYVVLVVIQSIGCYLVGVDGLVTGALNNWACFGKLWLFNMGFDLILSSMTARAFHLMVVSRVHQLSMQIANLHGSFDTVVDEEEEEKWAALHAIVKESQAPQDDELNRQLKKYKRWLPMVAQPRMLLYIGFSIVCTVVVTLITNVQDPQFHINPVNIICIYYWGFIPGNAFVILHFCVIFPLLLWKVWRERDALGIRNDLIICDTVGIICMILTLVWVVAPIGKLLQQRWPGLSFIWVYAVLIHISSVVIPLWHAVQHTRRAQQDNPCYQTTPQTVLPMSDQYEGLSRRSAFNRLLDDRREFQNFREYAASCLCSELTSFVDQYQMLKARLLLMSDDTVSQTTTDIDGSLGQLESPRLFTGNHRLVMSTEFYPSYHHPKTTNVLKTIQETCPHMTEFPRELVGTLEHLGREFIDPNSYSAINAEPQTARRFMDQMQQHMYPITLLDELKDEVLYMLYADVFARYIRR